MHSKSMIDMQGVGGIVDILCYKYVSCIISFACCTA